MHHDTVPILRGEHVLLMSTRHRSSKLRFHHGIVYYGGEVWTGKHEQWLRRQRFDTYTARFAPNTPAESGGGN